MRRGVCMGTERGKKPERNVDTRPPKLSQAIRRSTAPLQRLH